MDAIITEMDSYAHLCPMAKLIECRCHGGRLMISSMGLQSLMQYPETRALACAIYAHLGREWRNNCEELTVAEVRTMVE